ncbi:sugar transferase [Candidatus Parcubacteria bacterium]|nr:sugar transferase [Candidatus Parcubacteria bacterium]
MNNKLKKIILLLGDIAVLYIALYLTLHIRALGSIDAPNWENHLLPFTTVFLFWLLIFYISDLYNLHLAVNNAKFFQITVRSISIAGLLSAVYFYINPAITIAPKTNLIIHFFVFLVLFFLWRRIFNWLLVSRLTKEKIAFIGCNNQVKELIHYLNKRPHLGLSVALIVGDNLIDKINGIITTNNTKELNKIIAQQKISTIILASDPHQSGELRNSLFACLPLNINIISLPNFYETITGKIPIEAINQMWFLENLSIGRKKWFNILKRFYDIILALILLIISLPFWIIVALIIKIENKGNVFFLSERLGRNNKTFNLIKFRSMREENNDGRITEKNDPRVTKFGKFTRRTRIDELPQLINILKGEMSFIGPRPERPELIQGLKEKIPFYQERLLVKPGLSGWAQVNEYHSPTLEDTLKKIQYDLYYIKNRSLYLDFAIFLKTIATVFRQMGR